MNGYERIIRTERRGRTFLFGCSWIHSEAGTRWREQTKTGGTVRFTFMWLHSSEQIHARNPRPSKQSTKQSSNFLLCVLFFRYQGTFSVYPGAFDAITQATATAKITVRDELFFSLHAADMSQQSWYEVRWRCRVWIKLQKGNPSCAEKKSVRGYRDLKNTVR